MRAGFEGKAPHLASPRRRNEGVKPAVVKIVHYLPKKPFSSAMERTPFSVATGCPGKNRSDIRSYKPLSNQTTFPMPPSPFRN